MGGVYTKSTATILNELQVNVEQGFTSEKAEQKAKQYGLNITETSKSASKINILSRQMKSFIVFILLGAGLASVFLNNTIEAAAIIAIIIFIVGLGFIEEYKATKDMESLRKLSPQRATVLRNGKKIIIDAEQLVPGDIIYLNRGDIVPADCRIIDSSSFSVDESTLTGESISVEKEAQANFDANNVDTQINNIYLSSPITKGKATAVVIQTGSNTKLGKIASAISEIEFKQTPLQKRVDKLSTQFSTVIIILCIFVFIIGIAKGESWESMIILAVALAVSGIPESLPAVLNVSLAAGVKRMAAKNAIVKRLPAVETLGTCTVICTDKTGTLTQNKMVVQHIFTLENEVNITGEGFSPKGDYLIANKKINPLKLKTLKNILVAGSLCNNSLILLKKGEWTSEGEPTEAAILAAAAKAKIDLDKLRKNQPRVLENSFDSIRKTMSVVHKTGKAYTSFAKGAPEIILGNCSTYKTNKKSKKLTAALKKEILHKNEQYAQQGLRVIAIAEKTHSGKQQHKHMMESGLTFIGLIAMRDPPEPSAYNAVAQCQAAGIKVVMITGDNPTTATAIAKELGIFKEGELTVTGDQLDNMTDVELLSKINNISVCARTSPDHKLRVVSLLQKQGNIVAMTGDGVNDAPALKRADIGIAMGREGTDVAKETAEIVLKDDNFASIVSAIKEGRGIYNNIRRFTYYLLAGSSAQIIIILLASILGVPLPLTALMILFINLVTSDFPALGLAIQKPDDKVMKQSPRDPKESILNAHLIFKIALVVPIIVLGTSILFVWDLLLTEHVEAQAQTVALTTIIMFMIFHAFNAKSFDNTIFSRQFLSNKLFFIGIIMSLIATVTIIYWPIAQNIFGTVPLRPIDWIVIIGTSATVLWYIEIQKFLLNLEVKEQDKLEHHPTRNSW